MPKKRLSSETTSSGDHRVASSVEPIRSTNSTATPTLLASQSDRPVERVARHLRPHVASEQVVQALALAEAHNHVVEPTLEQADLAAVVYRDGDIEVPLLEPLDRITEGDEGSPTERATSTVASRPTIPAATLSTRTLTATRSSDAPSVRT